MKKTAAALLCLLAGALAWADLVIGLMPAINSVPLVVAERKGLFDAEGVRVRLELFQSQMYREAALQSHAIDGTVSDLINAIQGWSRGADTFVTSATEGGFSLLTSPRSPLRDMAGWRSLGGRKIPTGLLESSIVFYVTERILEAGGVDPACVQLVPIVQVPARFEMLLAGQVEAACLPEPLAALAVARGAWRIGDSDALGAAPGVMLFTRKAVAEKSAEIAAFYRAYNRAVDEVNANPEESVPAIIARCEFPPSVQKVMRLPHFRPAYVTTAREVRDVAEWMLDKGLIQVVPAYDEIIRNDFARVDARSP